MITLSKNWTEVKALIEERSLPIQYYEENGYYKLIIVDNILVFTCDIYKENPSSDLTEFETYYKSTANKPLTSYSQEGKPNVIASSRPNNTETYFTTCGDGVSTIGDGKRMEWDFSNSDDEVTAPTGFKRKRIDLTFIDPIWIKEGTVYFHNAPKGCYGDFFVVCPTGGYYIKNDGSYAQASEPTIIYRYVNKHPMQGSVPMGDELNTEETQINPILPGYTLRIEVTTPESDVTSNGVIEFESFRARTVIL